MSSLPSPPTGMRRCTKSASVAELRQSWTARNASQFRDHTGRSSLQGERDCAFQQKNIPTYAREVAFSLIWIPERVTRSGKVELPIRRSRSVRRLYCCALSASPKILNWDVAPADWCGSRCARLGGRTPMASPAGTVSVPAIPPPFGDGLLARGELSPGRFRLVASGAPRE